MFPQLKRKTEALMATIPPALESLRASSVRETLGLPPLESLTSISPVGNRTVDPHSTIRIDPRAVERERERVMAEQVEQARLAQQLRFDEIQAREREREREELRKLALIQARQKDRIIEIRSSDGDVVHVKATVENGVPILKPVPDIREGAGSSVSPVAATGTTNPPAIPVVLTTSPDFLNRWSRPATLEGTGLPPYRAGIHVKLKDLEPKKVVPSYDELRRKKGYYIVPWAEKFHYYKIPELVEETHLLRFVRKPATLKEGFVYHEKSMYYVTLGDLQRGIVRKSRKISVPANATYDDLLELFSPAPAADPVTETGGNADGASNSNASSQVRKLKPPKIKPRTGGQVDDGSLQDLVMGISKEVDLAFEKQIESLLSLIPEKEGGEWVIEES